MKTTTFFRFLLICTIIESSLISCKPKVPGVYVLDEQSMASSINDYIMKESHTPESSKSAFEEMTVMLNSVKNSELVIIVNDDSIFLLGKLSLDDKYYSTAFINKDDTLFYENQYGDTDFLILTHSSLLMVLNSLEVHFKRKKDEEKYYSKLEKLKKKELEKNRIRKLIKSKIYVVAIKKEFKIVKDLNRKDRDLIEYSFNLKNIGDKDITHFLIDVQVSDKSNNILDSFYFVAMELLEGESKEVNWQPGYDETRNPELIKIKNEEFENLKISCEVNEIEFADETILSVRDLPY